MAPRYVAKVAEFEQFKGAVKATGEAQNAASAKQALADLKTKERADEEDRKRTAARNTLIAGVRRDVDAALGASSGYVPPAPAASKCPDGQVCYDRAGLIAALRAFVVDVRSIVDEGAALGDALETARGWARESRSQP